MVRYDGRPGRSAPRGERTRDVLLAAAREVFCRGGYAAANVTDVVSLADASVGTVYHHFGGKADLFLALYEDLQGALEARATAAVRTARAAGETVPAALFLAGARAFLDGCWEHRDLAVLFLAGDGPPGFDLVRRRRFRDWLETNERLLGQRPGRRSGALTLVVTTVMAECGHEVALQADRRGARRFIDDVLRILDRVLVDG